jgi:hypothetical protein
VTEQSPTWQSYVSDIREIAERSSDELVRAELFQLARVSEKLRRIVGKSALPANSDALPEFEPPMNSESAKPSVEEAGSLLAYLVLMNQRR